MSKPVSTKRRNEAMRVLENLLRINELITPDILFVSLQEGGFTDDECCRLCGAILRTAKKNDWCARTIFSKKSKRNHSNTGSLWKSNIYGRRANGNPILQSTLDKERASWFARGYLSDNDHINMICWKVAQEAIAKDPNLIVRRLNVEDDGVACEGMAIVEKAA